MKASRNRPAQASYADIPPCTLTFSKLGPTVRPLPSPVSGCISATACTRRSNIKPIAVFEVLSPEDSLQRLKRKLEDYRAMGIAEIWVIDPQDSTFYRYENLQLVRNDSFSHPEKGIVFDMNQLKNLLY